MSARKATPQQVEDAIVERLRREVRRALRERRLVDIVVDPWIPKHLVGAYVNVSRDPRARQYAIGGER